MAAALRMIQSGGSFFVFVIVFVIVFAFVIVSVLTVP